MLGSKLVGENIAHIIVSTVYTMCDFM